MEQLTTVLVGALITIVPVAVSWLVAKFKAKTQEERLNMLADEVKSVKNANTLYIYCPKCQTKIKLSEVEIHDEDEEKHD